MISVCLKFASPHEDSKDQSSTYEMGTEKVNTGSPLLSGLHCILCDVVELVGATHGDEEARSSQSEISEEKPDQRALSA